jgi:hypothetical protein
MMPPSMIPTSGTVRADRRGMSLRMRRNKAVPASAKAAATSIFTRGGTPGATSVTTRRPRLADSTVPAVDGSTNRFWVSICMIMPATAMPVPERMIATVRGMRETSSTCMAFSPGCEDRSDDSDRSPAPIRRLTKARVMTASRASRRRFTAVREGSEGLYRPRVHKMMNAYHRKVTRTM